MARPRLTVWRDGAGTEGDTTTGHKLCSGRRVALEFIQKQAQQFRVLPPVLARAFR